MNIYCRIGFLHPTPPPHTNHQPTPPRPSPPPPPQLFWGRKQRLHQQEKRDTSTFIFTYQFHSLWLATGNPRISLAILYIWVSLLSVSENFIYKYNVFQRFGCFHLSFYISLFRPASFGQTILGTNNYLRQFLLLSQVANYGIHILFQSRTCRITGVHGLEQNLFCGVKVDTLPPKNKIALHSHSYMQINTWLRNV